MLLPFLALAVASPAKCVPVELAVAPKSMPAAFGSKLMKRASGNFAKAYAKACGQGLVKGRALPRQLFLHNAPDANVASIYRTGKIMVLEYPFVSGGKANVPSADELHEAIFCAVHGASPKEQEESGRCLPD
jgi:hypothetical protein